MSGVTGLILAAGESSRMGTHKALLPFRGKTLLDSQVQRLKEGGIERIYVVVGCRAKEIISVHDKLDVGWIENSGWQDGNFSSVLCGLLFMVRHAHHERKTLPGVLVLPVDVVGVEPSIIRWIAGEGRRAGGNIVPTFKGRGGHPVYLSAGLIEKIVAEGNPNSRLDLILKSDKKTRRLEAGSDSILNNTNSREDYEAL